MIVVIHHLRVANWTVNENVFLKKKWINFALVWCQYEWFKKICFFSLQSYSSVWRLWFSAFKRNSFSLDDFLHTTLCGSIGNFTVMNNDFGRFGDISVWIACYAVITTSIACCNMEEFQISSICTDISAEKTKSIFNLDNFSMEFSLYCNLLWEWSVVFSVPVYIDWFIASGITVDADLLTRADS